MRPDADEPTAVFANAPDTVSECEVDQMEAGAERGPSTASYRRCDLQYRTGKAIPYLGDQSKHGYVRGLRPHAGYS